MAFKDVIFRMGVKNSKVRHYSKSILQAHGGKLRQLFARLFDCSRTPLEDFQRLSDPQNQNDPEKESYFVTRNIYSIDSYGMQRCYFRMGKKPQRRSGIIRKHLAILEPQGRTRNFLLLNEAAQNIQNHRGCHPWVDLQSAHHCTAQALNVSNIVEVRNGCITGLDG